MSAAALDPERLASLEALVERLLPADELGPGAREAGAAQYIERALGDAYAGHLAAYQVGLDAIDGHAVATNGRRFAELEAVTQDELVAALEHGDVPGADGAEPFFELVRRHLIEGVFGDPHWGGNVDRAGWRLLGYPGPRLVWTDDDQRLG